MRCSSLTRRHCCCRAGYRGHTVVCIHLADILLKVLQYLMQLKTRRKSARFRVEACTAPYPDDYHQAFAISVLFCPHLQQCSLRLTCHPAAIRVYQIPFNIQKVRAGSVYSLAISLSMCSGWPCGATRSRTLRFRPFSIFGLLPITAFINSSHALTLLTSLAIQPHDACSRESPSRDRPRTDARSRRPGSFRPRRCQQRLFR